MSGRPSIHQNQPHTRRDGSSICWTYLGRLCSMSAQPNTSQLTSCRITANSLTQPHTHSHTHTQTESNLRQDLNNLKWGLFPQTSHIVNRCLTPKKKIKKRSAHTYTLPICPHCSVRPPASEMTIAIVAVHEEAGTTPSLHSLLLL